MLLFIVFSQHLVILYGFEVVQHTVVNVLHK